MSDRRNLIWASEVGEYVFCARAWRLHFDGYKPMAGHEARQAGARWHREHGQAVVRVRRMRLLAAFSSLLALTLAAIILLFRWWK